MADAPAPAPEPVPAPAPPPAPITLSDILNDIQVLQQKEVTDKAALDSIGNSTADSLRPKLIAWGLANFPNAYTLMEVTVSPPAQCSDGVTRNLADYITFCSGKTIQEHVALLQEKLTDMTVSFANLGYAIAIVVSRA